MGNCCGGESDQVSNYKPNAFEGKGNRLGSANDESNMAGANKMASKKGEEALPKPTYDPTLTDSARDRQREERLAAAEARLKTKKPKKSKKTSEPLMGPNSKPIMTWNVGG